MKSEQPRLDPIPVTADTSRVGEHVSRAVEIMPPQGSPPSKDNAVILSLVSGSQDKTIDAPGNDARPKKWSAAHTLGFALLSCGLFWLVAVLLAWAYLRVR